MAAGKGLNLINEEERLVYDGDGFKFFYRRIPNSVRGKIFQKHTKRGEVDVNAASIEMLEYCLLGWEGVFTVESGERRDVPFSTDKVRNIPDEVQAELIEKIGANADAQGADLGN